MAQPAPSRGQIASRIAASLLGSYLFVWGFVSLGIGLGVAAGMPYNDAQTLLALLAFLVFLVCFCWSFTAASLVRLWTVLAGFGSLMVAAGFLLSRALL